jgi:hypothetical protein
MAAYSPSPLVKTLQIKENCRVLLANAPSGFARELGPLPKRAVLLNELTPPLHVVVLFARQQTDLADHLAQCATKLAESGSLWVAWPAKSPLLKTDLDAEVIRAFCAGAGLAGQEVCALEKAWRAMRFTNHVSEKTGHAKSTRKRT